ncbi:unnamed protein product [Discosporangium mesarthrocarpum]
MKLTHAVLGLTLGLYAEWGLSCNEDDLTSTLRFVESTQRLYIEGGGCITLPEIFAVKETNPSFPIEAMDGSGEVVAEPTGIWYVTSDIYVQEGAKLEIHQSEGCDELRLKSDKEKFINLRAYGGHISILDTKVTSWDGKDVDTDLGDGRSYISAVSEVIEDPTFTCADGSGDQAKSEMGEARLDIINSDVGYLGYGASESYGITYKVRGLCDDDPTDLENVYIFDSISVRGNIRFSNLHDNYFGMYSYGHQDGLWEYNLMHDNTEYGFDPHDDSDNLRIHNNIVWNNGNHGIIASKRCNDVSIQNNIVFDNANAGIMLHRSSDYAIVRNNTVTDNGDACIAIFEAMNGDYSDNMCIGNLYGIRWSVGSSDNKVYDNTIIDSKEVALYFYQGSDPPYVEGSDGKPSRNLIYGNYINGAPEGIKIGDSNDNEFVGNTFENVDDLVFQASENTYWKDNIIVGTVSAESKHGACFKSGSDIDQSGGTYC